MSDEVKTVLEDKEYGFLFNLLSSEQITLKGNQVAAIEQIKRKIVAHLQPTQAPVEDDNGDSANTPE